MRSARARRDADRRARATREQLRRWLYDVANARDSDAHPAPLAQARAALEDGRFADAEQVIRRALQSSSPDTPKLLVTLAEVLQELDRYAEVDDVLRTLDVQLKREPDASIAVEAALARGALAHARGNDALARSIAEDALTRARGLGIVRPEATALEQLADTCDDSESEREEQLIRAALAIVETLPEERWWRVRLVVHIADMRRLAQQFAESEVLLSEARDLASQLRSGHPAHVTVLRGFGIQRWDQGRFADAESQLRAALTQSVASYGANDTLTASMARHLASLLIELNSYDEADALLNDAQRIVDSVDGPDHPTNWRLLQVRARLRTAQGRYDDAEHIYARALRHAQSRHGPQSLEVLELLKNAAILARDRYDIARALALYAEARPILEKFHSDGDIEFASLFAHLGDALNQDGKYAEGEAVMNKAIAIYDRVVGPDHHWALRARVHRAYAISNQEGRAEEAEAAYAALLGQLSRVVGTEHEDVGWVLRNIGELYIDTGRWAEALSFLTRALAIYEHTRGADHQFVVWPLRLMGVAHLGLGRADETQRLWERALRICEARRSDASSIREQLADLYEHLGRPADGAALRERSKGPDKNKARLS